jgi:nucleoside-diphosphate-sugar epimerase
MAARRLFCFGLGYSATFLARRLHAEGWRIAGTCRSAAEHRRLVDAGFDVHLFDRDRHLAEAKKILAGATHLLSTVAPDDLGDPVLDCHGEAIAALKGLEWVGYLSTTGVYGDRGGGWVDETTAPAPGNARSRRRLAAEQRWRALHIEAGLPVHLFRLAGIYGPGRSAIDQLRAGTARRLVKPGQVFSRIHVADLAAALAASMARPEPGVVYNLCDDLAAPADEVIAYAAALLGIEAPPAVAFADADLSPMARSFYGESRRVRNERIKQLPGFRLAYPSYREGLRAIAAADDEGL